jgi:hypothetical protein
MASRSVSFGWVVRDVVVHLPTYVVHFGGFPVWVRCHVLMILSELLAFMTSVTWSCVEVLMSLWHVLLHCLYVGYTLLFSSDYFGETLQRFFRVSLTLTCSTNRSVELCPAFGLEFRCSILVYFLKIVVVSYSICTWNILRNRATVRFSLWASVACFWRHLRLHSCFRSLERLLEWNLV